MEAQGTAQGERESPVEMRARVVRTSPSRTEAWERELEEKDALIERLRQMLGSMAEEQEVLKRLVHKQGGTSLADHIRSLKVKLEQANDEIASQQSEISSQAKQLRSLRERLDLETASAREARREVDLLQVWGGLRFLPLIVLFPCLSL